MNNNPFSRIELMFWNLTIRTLSQSDFARNCLRKTYEFTHSSEIAPVGILIGVTGAAGLASGYLFYFLTMGTR